MYIGVLSKKIDNCFQLSTDSKIGGDPLWIDQKEPTNLNWKKCDICKKELTFLFQLATSYEEYIRVIYIFCCLNNSRCNINKNSWICIKGKKKLFEFPQKTSTDFLWNYNISNNNNNNNNNNNSSSSGNINNNYSETNLSRHEPFLDTIHINSEQQNISFNQFQKPTEKKEQVLVCDTIYTTNEEKQIKWDHLLSKKEPIQKNETTSLFNSFAKSIDDIITAKKNPNSKEKQLQQINALPNGGTHTCNNIITYDQPHQINWNNGKNNIMETEENKQIWKNITNKEQITGCLFSSEHKHDRKIGTTNGSHKIRNSNSADDISVSSNKLPPYYIQMIEEYDEDFCDDYLYDRAKQLKKKYDENKQELENDEEIISYEMEKKTPKKKGNMKRPSKDDEEDEEDEGVGDYDNNNNNKNKNKNKNNDDDEIFENHFNGCIKLYSYLKKNFNQIVRYHYKGKFLYMHKYTKNYLMKNEMKCNNCGNKLVFEFQFFSTFTYHLEQILKHYPPNKKPNIENMLNNFNAGNVFIFTCDSDCVSDEGLYSQERVEIELF